MKPHPIESIIHPTDFSEASEATFAHALRIAVAARADLYIAHVDESEPFAHEDSFPRVRQTLARWGMIPPDAPEGAVADIGLRVKKELLRRVDPLRGLTHFIDYHACDLMVLASHERVGLRRVVEHSIGEEVARATGVASLFIREHQRGFVDIDTGDCSLSTILLPVDADVPCVAAWRQVIALARLFEPVARVHVLHVGSRAPIIHDEEGRALDIPIETRGGLVVETIVSVAEEINADLIAMPTEGRHGAMDAMLGSTTERVLREAPCPLMAVPIS